ncbi:unnamed protein product [Candidula unifasciata]|uniref:Thioredoxin domain-containing protein n=1 Tax=Candidula unifasciata TaxID=100452 RepID=A0A8S4A3X5_9EUPU|nr:unnamed protein product [Candidula unifasciata]
MLQQDFSEMSDFSARSSAYPPSPPADYSMMSEDMDDYASEQDPTEQEVSIENPDDVPAHDFFFDSQKVLSLNSNNFSTFLTRKDASLVMFYNERFPESQVFQTIFSEAANNTKRENSAFAGVDCAANAKLCVANGAIKLPMMRLYSKNYCIGEMKSIKGLSADVLRQFVEMAPMMDSCRMKTCTRKKENTC